MATSNDAKYWSMINGVMQQIRSTKELCVVCHRKQRARWADTGALRMTCGDAKCFIEWLPVKEDKSATFEI
jgi:hypothetical protein